MIGCTDYSNLKNAEGNPKFDNMMEAKEEAEFMAAKFKELNYEV